MKREFVSPEDINLKAKHLSTPLDIRRMEWQANYFASSPLLPRLQFSRGFKRQLEKFALLNKGFGALFVDYQPVNVDTYHFITNALKFEFGVSKSVVRYRLIDLGLLNDVRERKRSRIEKIFLHHE